MPTARSLVCASVAELLEAHSDAAQAEFSDAQVVMSLVTRLSMLLIMPKSWKCIG